MPNLILSRRDAIAGLLAISSASALAACKQSVENGGTADVGISYASEGQFFGAAELAVIAAIADTIIPETDTPGAVGAGVPDVIQGLASDWGDDDYRRYMRGGLVTLGAMFRQDGGQEVSKMQPKMRENLLSKYDAKVYTGEIEGEFYKNFKNTVATAYYMSEPGASQELAYEAVPGEWIGDAPLSQFPKTWAT